MNDSYDLFTEIRMFAINGGMDDALINGTLALDQEAGTIKGDLPDRSKWFDRTFIDDYLKRKGSQ